MANRLQSHSRMNGDTSRAQSQPVYMPEQLTPAMRKAAEAVKMPITVNDQPYFDALWSAIFEVAKKEQRR